MAVNLETLLPQAFSQTTPPVVPCNNGTAEESRFSDLFSSMYGSDSVSLLVAGGSNSLDFDPALVKSDFLSLDGGSQSVGEALYQADHSDLFSDWLTTPMSLPITPDEPLPDSMATSLPPISCFNSTYTAFPNHHAPSPADPLTPESLVSPESFCNSDEVDEVLSYLSSDSMTPLGANDAFNVFPSPSNSHLYNDNYPSSLHSSYTSLASSPTSPFSSSSLSPAATPLTMTPVPSPQPPTSLTLHPITPSDTIRDLLARNQPHASMVDTTSLLGANVSTDDSSQPQIQHANLQKRKCRASETTLGGCPSKKPAKGNGGRRRRVSTSTKKERKREQNKTAALRYRQKKKIEKVDYDLQQRELEERNASLRATLGSMEAEIAYLTRFWAEVQAKQQQGCQQ